MVRALLLLVSFVSAGCVLPDYADSGWKPGIGTLPCDRLSSERWDSWTVEATGEIGITADQVSCTGECANYLLLIAQAGSTNAYVEAERQSNQDCGGGGNACMEFTFGSEFYLSSQVTIWLAAEFEDCSLYDSVDYELHVRQQPDVEGGVYSVLETTEASDGVELPEEL